MLFRSTALLNTNLTGASLAHCVNVVNARAIVVDATMLPVWETARQHVSGDVKLFVHGDAGVTSASDAVRIDTMIAGYSDADVPAAERPELTINDGCLFIYTSGTTGMPKAANMNHYRVQLAMHGFSGVTGATRDDRMYLVLPMYHSNGGLGGTGAVLTVGGSAYIREKF